MKGNQANDRREQNTLQIEQEGQRDTDTRKNEGRLDDDKDDDDGSDLMMTWRVIDSFSQTYRNERVELEELERKSPISQSLCVLFRLPDFLLSCLFLSFSANHPSLSPNVWRVEEDFGTSRRRTRPGEKDVYYFLPGTFDL